MENNNVIDLTAPAPEGPDAAKIEALIAEAEQRGYLRARNEMAAKAMEQPALLADPLRSTHANTPVNDTDLAAGFLARLPRGVWD